MDKRTSEVKLNCVFRLVFEKMRLLYIYQKFTPTLRSHLKPTKIKLTKICTEEEIVAAIKSSYPHPRKLSRRKLNPRNIVTAKISTFTACMHACMHVCMDVFMHTWMYACKHTCAYVCIYVRTCTICIHGACMVHSFIGLG